MSRGYDYHRPESLQAARELRLERPGSRFIAGGTDLLVKLRKGRLDPPSDLISLRRLTGLRGIREEGGLRIGAMTTLGELCRSRLSRERFPILVQAAEVMGSDQIRNLATVGGNLCNASPAADLGPPLLVLEAACLVEGGDGEREIPIEDFFLGPGRSSLEPGEILTGVRIPEKGRRTAFLRRGRVRMDLAIASLAVALRRDGDRIRSLRLAAGAVAPVPLRLRKVETLCEGARPDAELLEKAAELAVSEIAPISDLRGSEVHRRDLVRVFVKRGIRKAMGD